ncbi:MAG: hypothetical protein RL685_6904 [Pseudomonadota bacterium]|jgi:hypothetical protein
MASLGSVSHMTQRSSRTRSGRGWLALAPVGLLLSLLSAGCGRFGFEDLPEFVGPSGEDTPDPCNLGTLSDCSACGDDCSARNLASVAGYACESATCAIASCAPNFADCNQDPSDGCERALDTLTDCGSCGQPCAIANGEAHCQGGTCQLSQCAAGFGDCDGDLATNGCERPVDTLTNCGACGVSCSTPNGETSCAGGVCQVVSCANGFDDCDGDPLTGCEAKLDSLVDCGSCRTPCDISGGENLACSGGVCSAASCAPSFADCNGDGLSCETDLRSLSNCVSCGVGCGDANGRLANATASCAAGACDVGVCDPGFGDCDTSPGNGCEESLDSLVDCGGCNVPCSRANADESCAGGSCVTLSCDPGFANCDGEDATGCEAQLGTDAHCSGCNLACGINETCQSGSCVGQFNTFQPDNVSLGSLNSPSARRDILLDCGTVTLNTGSLSNNGWCGRPGPPLVVQAQQNGPDLVVLPMRSLQLTAGTTFRVSGSRPVALVVFGDVSLDGTLDVSANGTSGGPGGHWNCDPDDSEGANGGDSRSDGGDNGGGGGGAFAAFGGRGGNGGGEPGGIPGQPRGSALLTPLIPGCRGGWGGGCGGAPGGGGGAVELAASGSISITGSVLARGSTGANGCDASGGATGGGSGGGILIQGNTVLHGGNLLADGGNGGVGASGGNGGPGSSSGAGADGTSVGSKGGGGGGGSAGRIRLAGAQGCSLIGSILPPASISCP